MSASPAAPVLVTGGNGFIASHLLVALLKSGLTVHTTVRNAARAQSLLGALHDEGIDTTDLRIFEAELLSDAGWDDAVAGCEQVYHTASPLPVSSPADADELIRPAREGTLRVLEACQRARVKRVVLTSSFAAIGYGNPEFEGCLDESHWTNPGSSDVLPYIASKTLAEKAAWEFIRSAPYAPEMATVNPVVVLGPSIGSHFSASQEVIRMMIRGAIPGCPDISMGLVDVRDVVDLHLKAMKTPEASGQRYLAVAEDQVSIARMARILRQGLGKRACKVPRLPLPSLLIRAAALVVPKLRDITPHLGQHKSVASIKARQMLGWEPRPVEETVLATAMSLLRSEG
ncbi:SDR family oxidoreductase [Pokkaliibacter sp. CJK22405]|uniref:SDR family oxidoreductase n=1 Tax=Pokkaliibacter sp. CJK22405 TaxID=3384615 RepID=UPI003984E224